MAEQPTREQPYEVVSQTPLNGAYALQERIDLGKNNAPDHLNQDITNLPGRESRRLLGTDIHYRPM